MTILQERYDKLVKELESRFKLEDTRIEANKCNKNTLKRFLFDVIDISAKIDSFFQSYSKSASEYESDVKNTQNGIDGLYEKDKCKLNTLACAIKNQVASIYYLIFMMNTSNDDQSLREIFEKSVIKNIGNIIIPDLENITNLQRDIIIHFKSIIENVNDDVIVYE